MGFNKSLRKPNLFQKSSENLWIKPPEKRNNEKNLIAVNAAANIQANFKKQNNLAAKEIKFSFHWTDVPYNAFQPKHLLIYYT